MLRGGTYSKVIKVVWPIFQLLIGATLQGEVRSTVLATRVIHTTRKHAQVEYKYIIRHHHEVTAALYNALKTLRLSCTVCIEVGDIVTVCDILQ